MQIVSLGDNVLEMSKPIWGKQEKHFKMPSAEIYTHKL